MSIKLKRRNLLLVLGVYIFLVGCTNILESKILPTTNTADAESPENTNAVSECASNKVENKVPDPNLPENYIGKTFEVFRLPSGLEWFSGTYIGDSHFAVVQVVVSENDTHLLWLSEKKCNADYIHDVVVLPTLRDNEELVIQYCHLNGQEDPEIVAVGEFTLESTSLTKIENVWRANRETKNFEVLSPDGIECLRDS